MPLVRQGFNVITNVLAALEIPAPAHLFVSWLNVHGMCVCAYGDEGFSALPQHLHDIVGPPVYLEDFEGSPADVLAPVMDVLWNAVGSLTPRPTARLVSNVARSHALPIPIWQNRSCSPDRTAL
jgi:hypothetical protein